MSEVKGFNIANKLTLRELGLTRDALFEATRSSKKPVPVASILAVVKNFKEQPSKLDPSKVDVKFIGEFEGKSLIDEDVELVRSGAAYFPPAAQDFLQGQLQGGGEVSAIAFVITAVKDDDSRSATKYKFGVQALQEAAIAVDPFKALRASLPSAKTLTAGKSK